MNGRHADASSGLFTVPIKYFEKDAEIDVGSLQLVDVFDFLQNQEPNGDVEGDQRLDQLAKFHTELRILKLKIIEFSLWKIQCINRLQECLEN